LAYDLYNQLSVLVVDDFKQMLDAVYKMLDEFGVAKIDLASSADEAIKYCKSRTYDVILCDYNLGENKKNGQHLLEILRQSNITKTNTLFVLITAETSKQMVLATFDFEPDSYLVKPFNSATLKQRLNKLLVVRSVLLPINQALIQEDLEQAIALCNSHIAEKGKQSSICRKILGECYTRQQKYDQAEKVYEEAMKRPLDWAQLGLAQVKIAKGEYDNAIEQLQNLLRNNRYCLKAYDLLVIAYEEKGDSLKCQYVLQEAAKVCPLSILRQQKLGEVAEANQDMNTAADAYLQSIRLGKHSNNDKAECYLKLGRITAALLIADNQQAETFAPKALACLTELTNKFGTDINRDVKKLLIKAQLHTGLKQAGLSNESLERAEKAITKGGDDIELDTQLEWIQTLSIRGEKSAVKSQLQSLAHKYKEDESALKAIDKLLNEPQNNANKEEIATINREGIKLYESGDIQASIRHFHRGTQRYPSHIAIHLNLAQVLMSQLSKNKFSLNELNLLKHTLKHIEQDALSVDIYRERYRRLVNNVNEIERQYLQSESGKY